ncbi:MAG: hypothetical protein GQ569_05780 [Methylococcaceae bacterium]|nr:hypothetical protein [Methylococcaceae bacterium]
MSKRTPRNKVSTQTNNPKDAYQLTFEAIVDQKLQKLPLDVQKEFEGLLATNRKKAEKVIDRLLELKQLYPKVPLLYNYISVAYGFLDTAKQKESIRENYQQNPQYLFARCHYGQLCLQDGNLDKIPDIFEHKYDLKSLYPRRNQFHATEFSAFAGLMTQYCYALGNVEQAEQLFKNMEEMVPDADETLAMRKLLRPNFFKKIVYRVVNKLAA